MRFTSTIAAGVAAVGAAAAGGQNYLGFNSGATLADGSVKQKSDFLAEFRTANNLKNAPGDFNSVRLYTNIQGGSDNDPISAFEAAIETKTKLLLGVWASGTDNIDNEIAALNKAVKQYGTKFTDLVIGITIGSEDLYRDSVQGNKNKAGVGNTPKAIVGFMDDFRSAFKTGPLADTPVGHADTWDAWGNSTVKSVVDASDFIAVHEYPYYEDGKGNDISNAAALFDRAYEATLAAAGGKPVWVTETGWPFVGPDWDEAEATVKNAEKYWQDVGCKKLFNKVPTFWYTLRDSNPDNKMKFGITENLSTEALWDLKCKSTKDNDSSSDKKHSSNSTATATATASSTHSSSHTTLTAFRPTSTGHSGDKETGSGSGSGSGKGSNDDSEEEGSNNGAGKGSGSGNSSNEESTESPAGGSGDSGSEQGGAEGETEEENGPAEAGAASMKVSFFGMVAVVVAGMTLF